MKAIRCAIWILSALLVLAALDGVPDPPAASPSVAKFKASSAAVHPIPVEIPGIDPPIAYALMTDTSFIAARAREADPITRPISTLTEQASDPSPPFALV